MNHLINREISCAAINDLSGLGKCSLTVALPVLSACGVETSVLPTAVLSSHTAFPGYIYRDLTPELLPSAEHWARLAREFSGGGAGRFSAVYSGFLSVPEQVEIVEKIAGLLGGGEALLFVDPVMGDGGKLYATITPQMAESMARLCRGAKVITPNLTEAAQLLGRPYREGPMSSGQLEELLGALRALGPEIVVLTGVEQEGGVGAAWSDGGEVKVYARSRVPGVYHGTGDLFAASLLGGLLNGLPLEKACRVSVDFTHAAIEATRAAGGDTRFGPKFERFLGQLARAMDTGSWPEGPKEKAG